MSDYQYPPLSPGSDIRLLRLMPHDDETAPIQCELFEYSFQESSKGIHLYEALSYVWGSLEPPRFISIDKHNFRVTENLHKALSHLRNRSLVRIIWIDAVCINQKDDVEKAHQIQSMAKIYGQANRVVVYLGEAADASSDQVLEDIRVAAEDESTNPSISEKSQEAIFELLERPWFQRIWVLQEVALARRILIMYGSAEMNGYTFCLGLNNLRLSYKDHSDLQSLIRSMTYLIRGAIFRPKYATSPSGGLSLGELVDMYHNREATVDHDMVYALLGMSSDNPNAASLSPDYTVPWKTVLQRLIEFILPKEVSVETWDKRRIAVIKGKGYILGQVSLVDDDSARYDIQYVDVVFNNTPKSSEYEREYGTRWTLQASAKSIWKRDFVCLLQGASKPAIIRAYKDHFAVIMIAVTLPQSARTESEYVERQEPMASAKSFSRDFLLVWNWEKPPGNLQDQAGLEALVEINSLAPEYLKTSSNKAVRSCGVALAFEDSKEYEEAEKRLQDAIEDCEIALGKGNPNTLAGMDCLALIYKSQQQWAKAEDLYLQVIQIKKRVLGVDHQDTLSSIANLASTYINQRFYSSRREPLMIRSLTDRIRDNVQITEAEMVQVAKFFGKGLIALLLDLKKDNVPVTKVVVEAAAGNEGSGEEVMALLLDQRGAEVKITEEVVKAAAGNKREGEKLMALLLDQRDAEVQITEEVVKAAAGNGRKGEELMALLLTQHSNRIIVTSKLVQALAKSFDAQAMKTLLDQRGDEVQITEEVVEAAAGNWKSGEEVMALLLDQRGAEVKITEEVVKAAAGNRREVMALLLDQRGAEVKITEEVVKAAAGNRREVMALLLDQRGAEIKITEEVVKAAAGNRMEGEELMALLLTQYSNKIIVTSELVQALARSFNTLAMKTLLDQRGDEVQITEKVVKAAAGNGMEGEELMALLLTQYNNKIIVTSELVQALAKSFNAQAMKTLLDQRGDEVQITEKVVKAAAGNKREGEKLMALLLDQRDAEVQITEEVVKAAAGNEDSGKEVMALLLDQRGAEVKITEEIVKAAAGNWREGKILMALLLDQRGAEVQITEEVIKAAAGNEDSGKEVMALLLDQRGAEVKITEEVVKAAAGNWREGEKLMALLLDQRGAEVQITEDVLKKAASNWVMGYKVLQLLHRTVSIKVTVGVIEAAATSGQDHVLGLLDQWDSIGSDKERWLNISRLYNAAKDGSAATVRRLLADGIPPDKRNIYGGTPLWKASECGHKEVVEVLLATSAVDVNVRNTAGQTPLFWAAAYGHSEVVRLLLDYGAELNYTDKDGRSPLSVAQFYREGAVVAMLTRHESTTLEKRTKKATTGPEILEVET